MERGSTSTVENFSLVHPLIKYWRRNSFSQVFIKAIGVIFLWNFSTSLTYNLPPPIFYLTTGEHNSCIVMFGLSSALFWLSPLAGYLADVKLSHFNTLRYSTYIMTVSVTNFHFDYKYNSFYWSLFPTIISHTCHSIISILVWKGLLSG